MRDGRLAAGITQQEVAAHLGITPQQVQKHETGMNAVPASRLYLLSRVLGLPVSFFFDISPAIESAELSGRECMRLVQAFNRIDDPAKRSQMLDLVKALGVSAGRSALEETAM